MIKRLITWLYERYCKKESQGDGHLALVKKAFSLDMPCLEDVSGIKRPKPEHEWRRDEVVK
jgi:hypothetical protein